MLDVNMFDQLKIRLATADQIRTSNFRGSIHERDA